MNTRALIAKRMMPESEPAESTMKDAKTLCVGGGSVQAEPGGWTAESAKAHSDSREAALRRFSTGATRDIDTNKYDYEGFLSPLVIERYGQFMHRHRTQADDTIRDSDNWQKGIGLAIYMKSLLRHVIELWLGHRGYGIHPRATKDPQGIEEVLCAILFNASGYLHEKLKAKRVTEGQ